MTLHFLNDVINDIESICKLIKLTAYDLRVSNKTSIFQLFEIISAIQVCQFL